MPARAVRRGGPRCLVGFHRASGGYESKPLRSLDPLEVWSRAGESEEFSDVATVGTLQRDTVGRPQFVSIDIQSDSPAEWFATESSERIIEIIVGTVLREGAL